MPLSETEIIESENNITAIKLRPTILMAFGEKRERGMRGRGGLRGGFRGGFRGRMMRGRGGAKSIENSDRPKLRPRMAVTDAL